MSAIQKDKILNASVTNGKVYIRRNYLAPILSVVFVVIFSFFLTDFILNQIIDDKAGTRNADAPKSILENENEIIIPELKIGVVGESPEVKENQVHFEEITLNDLTNMNLKSKYDGIMIMKDFLQEAAKSGYAEVYKKSGVPFFFIQSKTTYIPFIEEEIEYDDFPDENTLNYATGYYQNEEEAQFWEYGLYNDVKTDARIKDVYTRIFKTISTIKEK
jgi:hypothetical protein